MKLSEDWLALGLGIAILLTVLFGAGGIKW